MNRQNKSAIREWMELFGVPAAIIAGWVMAIALLATQVDSPMPLNAAIEKVIEAPTTQTTPLNLPTASEPIAAALSGGGRSR